MKKLYLLFIVLSIPLSQILAQCVLNFEVTETSCFGTSDGAITVFLANGVPPYMIDVNGQVTTSSNDIITISDLPQGTYSVSVSDSGDCAQTNSVTVTGPPEMIVTVNVQPNCFDSCIEVTAIGGTPPYTYIFQQGPIPGPLFCGLFPGIYLIDVTDANGCVVGLDVVVPDVPIPNVEIVEETLSCSEAILNAEVFGGTGGFTFEWSIGATGPSITVNQTGTYAVTVTDVNGCSTEAVYFYESGNNFVAVVQSVSCTGSNDGAIDGTLVAGTANSIQWIGPDGFTSNQLSIQGLVPGEYNVTIIDDTGCEASHGPYFIDEPAPITVAITTSDVICNGGSDGSINLTVSGGSGNYTFIWENGLPDSPNQTGLAAGNYNVTIVDGNGCELIESIAIQESNLIVITITASDQSCLSDGSASASASGGIGDYTYLWSNNELTQTIDNLIAGEYSVTVTDENGCTAAATVTIESPIDLVVSSTLTTCNTADGTATATILGGAMDPSFAWSDGQNTATAVDLLAGWYSVTVTDNATNCQVHRNVEVLEDPSCFVLISGTVYVDDIDQDCAVDSETVPAVNIRVELSDGQVAFTDVNGFYEFNTDAGNYDITIFPNSNIYESLCNDPITVDANEWGQSYSDNNFYLKFTDNRDIRVKVIKFNARPGFTQQVRICLMNVGAEPVSGTLNFTHPDILEYLSSNPTETSYDASTYTVTWDYDNIPPGAVWIYYPQLKVPVGTPVGTQLDYSFQADPIAGDLNPDDNIEECSIEVTGSYDPNDKAVAPAGVGPTGIISMADSLLSYTIRFQNTGNDTAFTVLLRDTLDSDLDLRSIEMGPASHDYSARLVEGNILEILFENIMLPDSFVNEPASNGFVVFDIKINEGSPYGTVVENKVGIYFDFNPPIITNTVVNTIQMIVGNEEINHNSIALDLLPNPTRDLTLLNYQLETKARMDIGVYDVLGNRVKILTQGNIQSAGSHQLQIFTNELTTGIYFIRLKTDKGNTGLIRMLKM